MVLDRLREWFAEDDDFLDGCDMARGRPPTRDEDVPWIVLFASVWHDRDEVERRVREWREMFETRRD